MESQCWNVTIDQVRIRRRRRRRRNCRVPLLAPPAHFHATCLLVRDVLIVLYKLRKKKKEPPLAVLFEAAVGISKTAGCLRDAGILDAGDGRPGGWRVKYNSGCFGLTYDADRGISPHAESPPIAPWFLFFPPRIAMGWFMIVVIIHGACNPAPIAPTPRYAFLVRHFEYSRR